MAQSPHVINLSHLTPNGRDLPRPPLPRGGHREEEAGRSERRAPGLKGSKNVKSEKMAYMSQKSSQKSESEKARPSWRDYIFYLFELITPLRKNNVLPRGLSE